MKICDYGCGREAKHYFKIVKKWCCSKSQNSCPKMRKDHSIRMTGKNNPMFGKQRAFTREEIRKQIKGRRLTISKMICLNQYNGLD